MIDLTEKTGVKAEEIEKVAQNLDTAIAVFEKVSLSIQKDCVSHGITELEDFPDDFFQLDGITSAMKHMRGMTKSNLLLMSDLELSATVRFLFETSLWVAFLAGPVGNGKRYFALSALENQRHLKKDIKHMEYELANLRAAEALEESGLRALAEKSAVSRQGNREADIKKLWVDIEAMASKKFSIYSDWVKGGNFAAVADHIETEILPDLNQLLASVDARLLRLKNMGVNLTKVKTDDLAKMADMEREYEWIFSHVSRKIHAEPFSISSDFSTNTNHEKFIYVQYILRKVNEMLAMSFEVFKHRKEFVSGI